MKRIIIFDFNRTIYNPESKNLIKNAKFVLEILINQGFILYLISQADSLNLRKKLIKRLGLQKYFEDIIVTSEKRKEDFRKIVNKEKITKKLSFVVGDRIRKEIFWGNVLGLKTIWFKNGKFSNESPRNDKEQPNYIIRELKEILKIIK